MIETFGSLRNSVSSNADMSKTKIFLKQVFIFLVILAVVLVIYFTVITVPRYKLLETFREKRNLSLIKYFNEPEVNISRTNLPWYFKDGTIYPNSSENKTSIWPNESSGDRIISQLMYVPKKTPKKIKKIYTEDLESFHVEIGRKAFSDGSSSQFYFGKKCPVDECEIVHDQMKADAVIFTNRIPHKRSSSVPFNQVWILFVLENPFHSGKSHDVNWTASYRTDSDIVVPYDKWLYYNEKIKTRPQTKNYALGKSKKVAWFVSNCQAKNNRMEYALELKKYIDVEIFGWCGDYECPRSGECLDLLTSDYKFYLAFENGNCREYITEKFFSNALKQTVLPIVMGADPDDYKRVAPYNSYIHVDNFTSPQELAKYLHLLDENDDLYNSYFEWKGTGEFIKTFFFCRVCAMLHSEQPNKSYQNFMAWWNGPSICKKGSWLK